MVLPRTPWIYPWGESEADAQRYHKSAWGDKTPAHWLCIDDIYQSFPHAVVIHLIRDPRQVVASLLRMHWGSPSVLGNAFYYERCVSTLLADPRVKHFQFEELHHHPRPILEQILQWVELPWSEQLLNHSQYSTNDVGGIPWLLNLPMDKSRGF